MLEIRSFSPSDTQGVKDVVHVVYDEYKFTWEEDGYHSDLSNIEESFDAFWVAVDQGALIGCVGLNLFDKTPGAIGEPTLINGTQRIGGCDCALNRLYLLAECRARGIGKALMGACLDEANARGRSVVEIWSDKRFEAAHRLYHGFGAKISCERICSDPDESPEWGLYVKL